MVQIHWFTSEKGKSTIACPNGANSLDGAHPIPSGAKPLLSQIPEMEIFHSTKIKKFPRVAPWQNLKKSSLTMFLPKEHSFTISKDMSDYAIMFYLRLKFLSHFRGHCVVKCTHQPT